MKLKFLSHAGFQITSSSGVRILIDPFLDDNPVAPVKSKDISAEYIILTHAHGDHIGDSFAIARRCKATFICVFELANYCSKHGFNSHGMHIGGAHPFPFGNVKFTIAHHGSITPEGQYVGIAAGVLLTVDGITIYHTGDTGLFMDMQLIGELNPVDVMLLPIGDNYTMGIKDAAKAVEFVKPKLAVPMHYNTFPLINSDPDEFVRLTEAKGFKAKILSFGEEIVF